MHWSFHLDIHVDGCPAVPPADVPHATFNPIALDVRYEALERGIIGMPEWSRATTTLAPVFEAGGAHGHVVAIEADLQVGSRRHRKRYPVWSSQALLSLLEAKLKEHDVGVPAGVRPTGVLRAVFQQDVLRHDHKSHPLLWDRAVALPPIAEPIGEKHDADAELLVSAEAVEQIVADAWITPELERGGLLLGRVLRNRVGLLTSVERYVAVECTDASSVGIRFNPDELFGVLTQVDEEEAELVVVGWHHTHCANARPHNALSEVDVATHHRVFRAPWNVASVAMCDRKNGTCACRWHGWRDANVRAIQSQHVRLLAGEEPVS